MQTVVALTEEAAVCAATDSSQGLLEDARTGIAVRAQSLLLAMGVRKEKARQLRGGSRHAGYKPWDGMWADSIWLVEWPMQFITMTVNLAATGEQLQQTAT